MGQNAGSMVPKQSKTAGFYGCSSLKLWYFNSLQPLVSAPSQSFFSVASRKGEQLSRLFLQFQGSIPIPIFGDLEIPIFDAFEKHTLLNTDVLWCRLFVYSIVCLFIYIYIIHIKSIDSPLHSWHVKFLPHRSLTRVPSWASRSICVARCRTAEMTQTMPLAADGWSSTKMLIQHLELII